MRFILLSTLPVLIAATACKPRHHQHHTLKHIHPVSAEPSFVRSATTSQVFDTAFSSATVIATSQTTAGLTSSSSSVAEAKISSTLENTSSTSTIVPFKVETTLSPAALAESSTAISASTTILRAAENESSAQAAVSSTTIPIAVTTLRTSIKSVPSVATSTVVSVPVPTTHATVPPVVVADVATSISVAATKAKLEAVSTTSTLLCGSPEASIVLDEAELIVAADVMNPAVLPSDSKICTGYYGVNEDDEISWSTNLDISDGENGNVYKGYSNIAIPGGNTGIGSTLGEFVSVPLEWQWSMTNTTAWFGNYIVDFVFSPIEGDWSSSSAVELMLYLDYSDDLGFIGQESGVVSTVTLFGVDGWSIYYGQGNGNVWMTASIVAPKDARPNGYFKGDVMEWINALKDVGGLTDSMYCSAANVGMEAFHGHITVQHVTTLKIKTTGN
ncbi:hypothetical protein G7046_g1847 [Stylonectria norvegica]|nr:hypothetical protein G7046_g1847 [Stylonectria norvegica]